MSTMMMNENVVAGDIKTVMKKGRTFLWWNGLLMILLGLAAMVYPGVFTLSLTYLVGGLFAVSGLVSILGSFAIPGTGPFFGSLFLSFLQLACGVILFRNPLLGAWMLTLMIALVFLLEGAMQFALAFEVRPSKGWGWMAFSAVVSVLAGFVVLTAMPEASIWVVGFIFGINFLSTGVSSMALSAAIPKSKS